MKVGEGEDSTSIAIHCHLQNNSCIKMGSDESHFSVSLTVRNEATNSVHRPQFLKRKERRSRFEPSYLPTAWQIQIMISTHSR